MRNRVYRVRRDKTQHPTNANNAWIENPVNGNQNNNNKTNSNYVRPVRKLNKEGS